MKINLPLFIFILLTKLTFGQQKSLLISTHLNTKTGKSVEKVSVVVDKVGTCITGNDGKCFYPTLKGIGMSVSIKASLSDYLPINNLELKSYRLSNQKLDTVKVIMSLKAEREKYALVYFEKETGIIIHKRFEQKEKNLYAQIKGLVAKMNDVKDKNNIAYQKLEKNLEEANKSLELVQKDKLKEESIAQRLAATLSMLEGEEIPDYISQAYNLFRQGNVEGADKDLNGNAIDDQILQAKLKKKIAKLLDESANRQLKAAIVACLFKAQLKSDLYKFKEAEIWYEKAYQADTNDVNTLFEYAYFLSEQDSAKRSINLYDKSIFYRSGIALADPAQYLFDVKITLKRFSIRTKSEMKVQKYYEHVIQVFKNCTNYNPKKFIPYLALIETDYALLLYNSPMLNDQLLAKSEGYLIEGLRNNQTVAVMLKDDSFWQKVKKVNDLVLKLIDIDSIYQNKLNLEKAVIDFNTQYPLATNEEKVSALGNGARFALFCKEYQLSEEYARKGLAIAPEQNWIYTNLALALLLQNRWAEAKQIYQEKQNLIGNNEKPLKDSFLNDLIALEKEGIRHPNFEKVRALLK